jgi:hypothetical protein
MVKLQKIGKYWSDYGKFILLLLFFGVSAPNTQSSSDGSSYFTAILTCKRKAAGLRQW